MSNTKVAPMPPNNIPSMAPEGQISVAALEAAMPKKVAAALQGKVDLNRNGYLDATEIGELFEDLQQSEEKRKLMTLQLIVAVSFLGLSILANLGTAWIAADAHQTTGTGSSASSTTSKLLTDKDGIPLRTDRSLDEHPMGSLLPDSAFQSLQYLAVTGPKGSLRMQVTATARFELATAQYNSVVVVYTSLGSVEFDGTNMLMTDITADAFHRAGFITTKSRRSDSHNPHQRFARDVSKITGMFSALSKIELSEWSTTTMNANGDPILPFQNNVLANMSEAYIQEDHFIKCDAVDSQSTTDCSGGVVGESLFEFEDAEGETFRYLKRTKHMVSTVIEGKMMTYAETTMAEYPGATLVDLTGEDSKISTNYVTSDSSTGYDAATSKAEYSTFYCDSDTNVTKSAAALPLPQGNNIPAVAKNDGKHVLTYAGNEMFFGVDARKYWVHKGSESPWVKGTEKIAVYEHAVESRLFALSVTPIFQKTWVAIGPTATAPAAFLARANAHTSKATIAAFLAGPDDCGKYALEPVAAIVTNATMAKIAAPAPLAYFRNAMITSADFKYVEEGMRTIGRDRYARMRRSTLLPGEDGLDRERRELKQQYRATAAGLTKRQKEHVYHAGGLALKDTEEGREEFLGHFVDSGAVVQFEDPADEDHHRSRRMQPPTTLADLIAAQPHMYATRERRAHKESHKTAWSEHQAGDCYWETGEGSGASTTVVTNGGTKEECEKHVLKLPNANGATWEDVYEDKAPYYGKVYTTCYANYGMTGHSLTVCKAIPGEKCPIAAIKSHNSMYCRFKVKASCKGAVGSELARDADGTPVDYGDRAGSLSEIGNVATRKPLWCGTECGRKYLGSTRSNGGGAGNVGLCEQMAKNSGMKYDGVDYSTTEGNCYGIKATEEDGWLGTKKDSSAMFKETGTVPYKFVACKFTKDPEACSEASSADCHPWGSGGNTPEATFKKCGGVFTAFADCTDTSKTYVTGLAQTPGYGWEGYQSPAKPAGVLGNPWFCADDAQVCKTKNHDYKAFELGVTVCMPTPLQYNAKDPRENTFYMCRSAMQGTGFSAKASGGKVFGICTPSITGSGYLGRDNSCTMMGEVKIEGNFDCEVEMFGYGIYGGAGISFAVQIYKGFAQGVLAANIYVAAGDKDDPFLTGSLTVEISDMSFACCWRRQKRLKVDFAFIVDVWILPTFSYNTVIYNSKYGASEPGGCSAEVLKACKC